MKVAIISDIHANIFAFNRVMEDIQANDCEHILVLGDLVGYYYWPKSVVDIIRNDTRFICIKGNHEVLLDKTLLSDDFSRKCKDKYGSGLEVCKKELDNRELQWLANLPEELDITLDGCHFKLRHGSDRSINEYLYPDIKQERVDLIDEKPDYYLFGHTHIIQC